MGTAPPWSGRIDPSVTARRRRSPVGEKRSKPLLPREQKSDGCGGRQQSGFQLQTARIPVRDSGIGATVSKSILRRRTRRPVHHDQGGRHANVCPTSHCDPRLDSRPDEIASLTEIERVWGAVTRAGTAQAAWTAIDLSRRPRYIDAAGRAAHERRPGRRSKWEAR